MEFKKNNEGLIPAIIQDQSSREVLMLGYMNDAAFEKTLKTKKITFYSRSKQRLWTKGEESGNYLAFQSVKLDCDRDTLLFQVVPAGPTCHMNTTTCWGNTKRTNYGVLDRLQNAIADRVENPLKSSYVSDLFEKGINKIAQKVGEEAVEVVIEAKDNNDKLFLAESADLLFHYLSVIYKIIFLK